MNKQILRIAIAFPMLIASATSSLANQPVTSPVSNQLKNRVNIDNLQLIDTQQQIFPSSDTRERPKPKGPKGFEIGVQQTPNQQEFRNPGSLVERPKPKGPGGHDPGLQVVPQQQLQY